MRSRTKDDERFAAVHEAAHAVAAAYLGATVFEVTIDPPRGQCTYSPLQSTVDEVATISIGPLAEAKICLNHDVAARFCAKDALNVTRAVLKAHGRPTRERSQPRPTGEVRRDRINQLIWEAERDAAPKRLDCAIANHPSFRAGTSLAHTIYRSHRQCIVGLSRRLIAYRRLSGAAVLHEFDVLGLEPRHVA